MTGLSVENVCMLIDPNSPINNESSETFWNDELKNSRYLLGQIDKAIAELTSNPTQSYTIDTGQTKQTVTKADLVSLYQRRDALIGQIAVLESRLNIGGSRACQIIPGY